MKLALTLFKDIYPKEIQEEFETKTMSPSDWDDLFDDGIFVEDYSPYIINHTAKPSFESVMAFFETLLVRKIDSNKEVDELDYQLDH